MAENLILEARGLDAGYGEIQVLWGVDLAVRRGEITALIGSNGAGKTTLMRTLSGLVAVRGGVYRSEGHDLAGRSAAEILSHGIVHVPEGRRLFGAMSVEENLLMGAYLRSASRAAIRRDLDQVYTTFPKLRERRNQQAATLSGGEQQMCAIGRGLMSAPLLLMIDELSLGLSPLLVEQLVDALRALNKDGTSILLVEQDVTIALDLCDRAFVMDMGRIVREGSGEELLADPIVRDAYLGVLQE
ncbi:amino acid/amide ABC transporter ATP-binding protein 2 (HAAT family) [Rhodopseudomonas thermotolerans]|uniref:Amino acid/amide ABC transporter ATP-binding protein 2 (HAAT family) n=2 Tax=Rhodopseudomonas TaxID=1073 RepID=A0A336JM19_9BRAD|nr:MULTISPECIES: ABC transporter ATP-binding protein [Rhodopseudomonas]RED36175.1 amino acid/amide ABC transporter ATP-binding protein 2 (HAAT family) [Rhodopseudomonas pentothenatexigens]REG03547.1 amino acid/amide ABC transporter ATP-binding protein 2 (HAAT family) [Rhodopseudomonas thermotolerans]SSW90735.1 amino acid/amide ABC transporter ATP-binding protein 2 (HAAT family) [Rhodopseudomonas pentothenatexigens]